MIARGKARTMPFEDDGPQQINYNSYLGKQGS
jgi:hypothetical protein